MFWSYYTDVGQTFILQASKIVKKKIRTYYIKEVKFKHSSGQPSLVYRVFSPATKLLLYCSTSSTWPVSKHSEYGGSSVPAVLVYLGKSTVKQGESVGCFVISVYSRKHF